MGIKLPKAPAPRIVLPGKKAQKKDDADTEDEPEEKTRLALPKPEPTKVAPIMVAPPPLPPDDLTDDEVAENVAKAVKLTSTFGYKSKAIQAMLKGREYDKASLTAKEALLSTIVDLLPLAESSFRKSGGIKGTYQFMALIGQVRELLVELDGERDLRQMVQSILDTSVHPLFILLSQQVIQFNAATKRRLRAEYSEQECKEKLYPILDEHIKDLATFVQGMYDEIRRRVEKSIESKG